jgi:hypothetical protein
VIIIYNVCQIIFIKENSILIIYTEPHKNSQKLTVWSGWLLAAAIDLLTYIEDSNKSRLNEQF